MSAGSNISCSFKALYFWNCAQVTAGSNVLGSFSAFCYKFCEQVTTGANVRRFLVYHIIDLVQKSCCGSNIIAIFLLVYFIMNYVRKWLREQWWFRGGTDCIREWDVCRSSFCLIFSLIFRKWLQELAFFLDHFTSFNWNFLFL